MSDPTPGPPDEAAPIDRSLGAFVVGGAAGLLVFAGLVSAGVLLYQRVYGDSWVALLVILAVFGGFGAYLAWLVGVLAFSAVRRPGQGDSVGE
jgi:hypothetical protein